MFERPWGKRWERIVCTHAWAWGRVREGVRGARAGGRVGVSAARSIGTRAGTRRVRRPSLVWPPCLHRRTLFCRATLAPAPSSAWTTTKWPWAAANINAVHSPYQRGGEGERW